MLTSTDPSGGSAAWQSVNIDGTTTINSIACNPSTLCVAVDSSGNVLTHFGSSQSWTKTNIDSTNSLTSVSCGTTVCVAVDSVGNAIVGNLSNISNTQKPTISGINEVGETLTTTNGTWST